VKGSFRNETPGIVEFGLVIFPTKERRGEAARDLGLVGMTESRKRKKNIQRKKNIIRKQDL